MSKVRTIPVRFAAALGMAGVCICLVIAAHHQRALQKDYVSTMPFGAPPPPAVEFAEAFVAIPGVLAGLPLVIAGGILGFDSIVQTGMILGAAFFWYCIGWQVDYAHAEGNIGEPPVFVRWYLSALIILSVIFLPLGVLAGLNLGVHSCAVGVPPYWAEVLSYGIVMFWLTIGAYFGWLRWRVRREQTRPTTYMQ